MSYELGESEASFTFGERLRQIRRNRGLTLKQVSVRSGLSISFLSDLERNQTSPSTTSIQRLANALKVSPSRILTGVDFSGTATELPSGLAQLRDDPIYGNLLTDDWIRTLARIQHRGRRPRDKHEWLELFLHLRRLLGPDS